MLQAPSAARAPLSARARLPRPPLPLQPALTKKARSRPIPAAAQPRFRLAPAGHAPAVVAADWQRHFQPAAAPGQPVSPRWVFPPPVRQRAFLVQARPPLGAVRPSGVRYRRMPVAAERVPARLPLSPAVFCDVSSGRASICACLAFNTPGGSRAMSGWMPPRELLASSPHLLAKPSHRS